MKKIVSIIIVLFMAQLTIKAEIPDSKLDTLDFWHVYYNKFKIKEFNELSVKQITFKKRDIKSDDILSIEYFNDTPCADCKTSIIIKDKKHNIIIKKEGKGNSKPISIPLRQLILSKKEEFDVFYSEQKNHINQKNYHIFKITLAY